MIELRKLFTLKGLRYEQTGTAYTVHAFSDTAAYSHYMGNFLCGPVSRYEDRWTDHI